jgi:hypothetical protein
MPSKSTRSWPARCLWLGMARPCRRMTAGLGALWNRGVWSRGRDGCRASAGSIAGSTGVGAGDAGSEGRRRLCDRRLRFSQQPGTRGVDRMPLRKEADCPRRRSAERGARDEPSVEGSAASGPASGCARRAGWVSPTAGPPAAFRCRLYDSGSEARSGVTRWACLSCDSCLLE